jgi:hypothetical protein
MKKCKFLFKYHFPNGERGERGERSTKGREEEDKRIIKS